MQLPKTIVFIGACALPVNMEHSEFQPQSLRLRTEFQIAYAALGRKPSYIHVTSRNLRIAVV